LLVENGRLGRLLGVAKAFGQIMSAHRGEVSARVTTAKQLNSSQQKELESVLQAFIKSGHKLSIESKVDPSIIGGMVIELGDRYIDLSIASKLKTYSSLVKETL
jgi:F-type H+-transporting ATPase subunit O